MSETTGAEAPFLVPAYQRLGDVVEVSPGVVMSTEKLQPLSPVFLRVEGYDKENKPVSLLVPYATVMNQAFEETQQAIAANIINPQPVIPACERCGIKSAQVREVYPLESLLELCPDCATDFENFMKYAKSRFGTPEMNVYKRTCQACGVICEPVEVHTSKQTNQTTTSAILHLCERCSDNHFETLKKGK